MMERPDKERAGTALVPAYEVGYGKPPAQHRFQKGTSGNPGGRPRRSRNKPKPFNPAHQPTDGLILEEAYRLVTIREGDKLIELPAIQASMRALTIAAMKGSRLSQKALAEIVREIEARKEKEHLLVLENSLEYKKRWKAEIERCERQGLPHPKPIPDPDDIIINFRTGEVRTEGPLDEREKAKWDQSLERRAEAQELVSEYAALHKRARSDHQKEYWWTQWLFEQYMFDLINDTMPERYKAKLKDRSYDPEASREGEARKQLQAGLARGKG